MNGSSAFQLASLGAGCWRSDLGLSLSAAGAAGAAVHLAGAAWLYLWDRHCCLRPGSSRLTAAVPLVALNLVLPLLFCRSQDAITMLITVFNLTWLSTFKALSWALNRGPLCMPGLTPIQFLAVYATPVTPVASTGQSTSGQPPASKGGASAAAGSAGGQSSDGSGGSAATRQAGGGEPPQGGRVAEAYPAQRMPRVGSQGRLGEDAGSSTGMLLSWLGKLALIAIMVWVMQQPLPGLARSFAYALALYSLLSAIMDGPASLVIGLTGLRVSPHFDRPWMATSVAGFWSKHWDLAAGNTLRQLVYDPVCEGRWVAPPGGAVPPAQPSGARMVLGTAASFAASGAVHEIIFWYLTGRTTGGIWLCFFAAQAPLVVAERAALAALKLRGIRVPTLLRRVVTLLLLVYAGQLLFWPPAMEHGVVSSLIANTQAGILQLTAAARVVLPPR
ncbi:hypothetical protein ABPG77_007993 [Micractinium sp. CCAP 211/92]